MSTDETPPEGGRGLSSLKARWDALRERIGARWPDALKGPVALAAAGALVVGFGGGFAAGKADEWFGGGRPAGAESVKGQAWALFGKPRGANAPRRGIPKPEDFAVWRTRVDSSGQDPLACIRMSKDLDPSKAYADFVLVSPDLGRQPSVRVKGDELCLGGIGFTDHRITLLKGLPARGGETLAANADVDFTFGEKPPYVGFAGDGVILPREESDGVAIETINVQTLAVEVWRVPDRNLVRKSISAPDPTGEGERQWTWQTCTEFAFFQTCEADSECPFKLDPPTMPLASYFWICAKFFGISEEQTRRAVASTNARYGGDAPGGTRILFPSGSVDPWIANSFTSQTFAPRWEPAFVVPGASHHAWTHPPRDSDSDAVKRARAKIEARVDAWLDEGPMPSSAGSLRVAARV